MEKTKDQKAGFPSSLRKTIFILTFGLIVLCVPFVKLYAQPKPAATPLSLVLNDSFALINGKPFGANKMIADDLFKVLGKPEQVDTLTTATIKSIALLEMATINKYVSKGFMLEQGRQTARINTMEIFLNPDPQKDFVDYLHTPFKGKLMVLGVKIDSTTTVKQLETAFSKYAIDVNRTYQLADMTIYDKKTTARLLEVKFRLAASSEKIERIEFRYYPNEPLKKHKLEYKETQMYLDGLLLDTTAGKTTEMKKILGAPNGVIDITYGFGRERKKAVKYVYDNICGLNFAEDPSNNSLLYLEMGFLTMRKKSDLANPVFDLVINKKTFNPGKAVPKSQDELKPVFGFDSTIRSADNANKEATVTAYEKNAYLSFRFDGDLDWYTRVYTFTFEPKYPPVKKSDADIPAAQPDRFIIKDGSAWLEIKGKTIRWDMGADAMTKFFAALGKPSKILDNKVSEFADYGFRVWIGNNGLEDLLVFLTPIKNAYSGLEQSPGIFKGIVEIEGKKITPEMTVDDIYTLLPGCSFKEAYTNKTEIVYKGRSNGIIIYLTFHKSSEKLSNISISRN